MDLLELKLSEMIPHVDALLPCGLVASQLLYPKHYRWLVIAFLTPIDGLALLSVSCCLFLFRLSLSISAYLLQLHLRQGTFALSPSHWVDSRWLDSSHFQQHCCSALTRYSSTRTGSDSTLHTTWKKHCLIETTGGFVDALVINELSWEYRQDWLSKYAP